MYLESRRKAKADDTGIYDTFDCIWTNIPWGQLARLTRHFGRPGSLERGFGGDLPASGYGQQSG